ncbi:MAG: CRTAC1 family protein [Saprospiraceae bacterium]|nr:CRTAC1 family protein [Saprospiraceae bacterium]
MHKSIANHAFIFCFLIGGPAAYAQNDWEVRQTGRDFFSGIPVSCADVNGDALDDLLVLDQAKHLWLGLQYGTSKFHWVPLNYHHHSASWSLNVADLDRNGFNDLIISSERSSIVVLYQNANGFSQMALDDPAFFSQGAAAYDIDADGWTDFTICDDNHATRIYRNDRSGSLIRDHSLIDLRLVDPDMEAGNYGCIWTDLENDGDPDLYISKCRPGVEDSTDPRRVNMLFVKEGASWQSRGEEFGLADGSQSWISLFEDFDNDGLKDCFVLNHYSPNRYFHQRADHRFEDRTLDSGIDHPGIGIQAIAADFDNDGDLDLLLSGTSVGLWDNDGNGRFHLQNNALKTAGFSSCAAGDFNGDGFIDLYALYADLLNLPNNQRDQLWLNPGNGNGSVTIQLKGISSNPNGIGARVVLYRNQQMQSRELHAGEAYGIQHSLNLHFGLGTHPKADSMVIYWPSGNIDVHRDLPAGYRYRAIEGGCLQSWPLDAKGIAHYYCKIPDTLLLIPTGIENPKWNTGWLGDSLAPSGEGIYYYTGIGPDPCEKLSLPVAVIRNPQEVLRLTHRFDELLCSGTSIELGVNPPGNVQWSTGKNSESIIVDHTGFYFAVSQGFCGPVHSDTLRLLMAPRIDDPEVKPDTLRFRRPAVLTSQDDSTRWYNAPSDSTPIHTGRVFISDTIGESRSFWAENHQSFEYPSVRGGLLIPEYESSPYHASFLNNQMVFDVYEDLVLDSVTLYTGFPGERTIDLLDALGKRIATRDVVLSSGKNQVYLGFAISAAPQSYLLTTNQEKNLLVFGENSPRLYRSDKGFYYPFFIEDKLRIVSSDKGDSYYYYFYDWVIRSKDRKCVGERVEVPVIFAPVGTEERPQTNWSVQIQGRMLMLASPGDASAQLDLIAGDGRNVYHTNTRTNQWHELAALPTGLYLVRFHVRGVGVWSRRLLID